MKIEGPGNTGKTAAPKKLRGAASSDGGGFATMVETDESPASPATTGAAAAKTIARIDSLLTLQEMEDPAEIAARNRSRKRSENILRELDRVRHAMLTGRLTVGHMIDMADVVASHRQKINDPQLTAILDEIDLRAQVEIAKMRYVLDKARTSA